MAKLHQNKNVTEIDYMTVILDLNVTRNARM